MSTNNIDKHIADKLKNREISPSSSAWERLNSQLDEHQSKKKSNRFLYVGCVAGLALLISFGMQYLINPQSEKPIETLVETSIDTLKMNNVKIEELIKDTENAVVQAEQIENETLIKEPKSLVTSRTVTSKQKVNHMKKVIIEPSQEVIVSSINNDNFKETAVASVTIKSIEAKSKSNSRIKVNSVDLLFAVTHNSEEIETYYAKHKVKREDVLKTIKDELKKSEFSIDPNTILAEVERTIDDEEYNGDFMQKLKSKISNIAVAIVERNK